MRHTSVRASWATPDQQNLRACLRLGSCCSRSEPGTANRPVRAPGFAPRRTRVSSPTDRPSGHKQTPASAHHHTPTAYPPRRGVWAGERNADDAAAAVVDAGEKNRRWHGRTATAGFVLETITQTQRQAGSDSECA